jgi:hypothetical protein
MGVLKSGWCPTDGWGYSVCAILISGNFLVCCCLAAIVNGHGHCHPFATGRMACRAAQRHPKPHRDVRRVRHTHSLYSHSPSPLSLSHGTALVVDCVGVAIQPSSTPLQPARICRYNRAKIYPAALAQPLNPTPCHPTRNPRSSADP